jgi:hypothetical protein
VSTSDTRPAGKTRDRARKPEVPAAGRNRISPGKPQTNPAPANTISPHQRSRPPAETPLSRARNAANKEEVPQGTSQGSGAAVGHEEAEGNRDQRGGARQKGANPNEACRAEEDTGHHRPTTSASEEVRRRPNQDRLRTQTRSRQEPANINVTNATQPNRTPPKSPTKRHQAGSGSSRTVGGLGGSAPQNHNDRQGLRSPQAYVGEEGVEPSRPYGHTDLNRARLPFRHSPRVVCGRSLQGPRSGLHIALSLGPDPDTIDRGAHEGRRDPWASGSG